MSPQPRAQTQANYLIDGRRHLKRARKRHPEITDDAEALVTSIERDPGCLTTRTICVYRAEVGAMLQVLLPDAIDLRTVLSARIEAAFERRRGIPEEPQTSSRKRRHVPPEDVTAILAELARRVWTSPDDRAPAMLALSLYLFPRIGNRPIEAETARLQEGWLVLRNAKHNIDRAAAVERRIDIMAMHPLVRRALEGFFKLRAEMVTRYGSYAAWYAAASELLGRICRRCRKERICLTSLRHTALATWKRAGLSPWTIAALAGHASDRSAHRYYASARSGWDIEGRPQVAATRILLLQERARFRAERKARAMAAQTEELFDDFPVAPERARPAPRASSEIGASNWTAWVAKHADLTFGSSVSPNPSDEDDRAEERRPRQR